MAEAIAVYHQRMHSIIDPDAKLEKLADGAKHTEGPVYTLDFLGSMLWSVIYFYLSKKSKFPPNKTGEYKYLLLNC